ncbi:MAG: methyltransferase domain-containing protein [Bacteroidales bacterium]|nr:methyltransferase domain-containing protein [Bacteroidales bacterium]
MIINQMQAKHDIMGQAGMDFLQNPDPNAIIKVWSDIAETDELPVSYFFRTFEEMPLLEQQALSLCRGKVLDVGAGMGSHSLYLQEKKADVTALEISPMACEVMKLRGVQKVLNENFYNLSGEIKYDTVLFLMNGMGIAENIDGFKRFFNQLRLLLAPGGQVLMDSSDLKYLFLEEDGSIFIDLNAHYYGEIIYKMSYRQFKGKKFPWLFIDESSMEFYAKENGFCFHKLLNGKHYDYMGRLEIDNF